MISSGLRLSEATSRLMMTLPRDRTTRAQLIRECEIGCRDISSVLPSSHEYRSQPMFSAGLESGRTPSAACRLSDRVY